jgi:hypothetical protein
MVGGPGFEPGPHGPEICVVLPTETVFEGFKLIWSQPSTVLKRRSSTEIASSTT